MVSVPLDEDHSGLPAYVEHDGTGTMFKVVNMFLLLVLEPYESICEPSPRAKANRVYDNSAGILQVWGRLLYVYACSVSGMYLVS